MHKRFGVIAVASAVTAILALPSLAAARTQTVWAGGTPNFQNTLGSQLSAEANDFFPHTTTIHVGDTISWQGMAINFHTIDLPGQSGADLPLILPNGQTAHDVLDAAGNPFWFNGQPIVGFNPRLLAPLGGHVYDGSERVASGLPFTPDEFKVTFSKPGVYTYFCDVHYDMRGVIVVKPSGDQVPTGEQIAAQVAAQQARDTEEAERLSKTNVTGHVSVGLAGNFNVEILAMFPSTLRVKTGTTVEFALSPGTGETHTATFGPDDYLLPLAQSFLNPAGIDPRAVYPSSPPGMPIVVSPTSHGNGFANAGVMDRDLGTPQPPESKFTFSTPGTYNYICLIHPFMHGTIVVGP